MTHDTDGTDSDATTTSDEAAETAAEIVRTAGEVVELVEDVSEGDAAGAVTSGLVAAGSATSLAEAELGGDASDARAALSTAGAAAGTAGALVGVGRAAAEAPESGVASRAPGAVDGATQGATHLAPEGEAGDALSDVGQTAGAARGLASAAGGSASAAAGSGAASAEDVEFHLEVSEANGQWGVRHIALTEMLNTVPTCTIEARYSEPVEASELLHKEVRLTVERGAQQREFTGIVWHARASQQVIEDNFTVHLVVRPAMGYLGERVDSHIYQNQTVVEVIKAAYREMVGELSRTVDDGGLQRAYLPREYIVQYQESHLDFISRLTEEEGIFWFFDYEGDHEVLTLVDTVSGLDQAREDFQGRASYNPRSDQPGHEAVFSVRHHESVGATDAVVADYDWSHPALSVRGEATGRSEQEPTLEIYDHTDALTFHSWDSQYGGNTASDQARLRAERLDLQRQKWELGTTIVTATPGRTLELEGAPDGALDQRYLIVASSSQGHTSEGRSGRWGNTLEVVPTSMPYRPARITPRPVAYGPELATVVGPGGPAETEIHTDEHGRVRVHFAWDRYHDPIADDSSCWMRVAHNWAGPGFGTFFLPRVGMEVLVQFLGGNPDRPLITGCVYNGDNRAGVELDAKKTQSLIRTKSSPNSEGFNELRFEDEAGSEFIYTHAQKDYNEEVEHNHSTHVKVDQSNTVDHDQTETVGNNQTLHVKAERRKTVDQSEWTEIGQNRTEVVDGSEDVIIKAARTHSVNNDETLTVEKGDREVVVKTGEDRETFKGGRVVTVHDHDDLHVTGGANRTEEFTGERTVTITNKFDLVQGDSEKLRMDSQKTQLESGKEIALHSGSSDVVIKNDGNVKVSAATKVEIEVGGCKIEMTTTTITLTAGASSIELGPSGAKISGPTVSSSAQTMNEVTGLLVKIN